MLITLLYIQTKKQINKQTNRETGKQGNRSQFRNNTEISADNLVVHQYSLSFSL